jgi:hypothetical protein
MFCVFQFIWPGKLVELPCKFSKYDYTNAGHFFPWDLAHFINERGRERDNMMVFNILDIDGKIKYIIQLLHLHEINMRFYGAQYNNIERGEAEFNIVVLCSIKPHY